MIDRQVGEVLALLKQLGIEENTLVMFSGDNGGADYFSSPEYPRGIHSANKHPQTGVEYRGKKGNLYEGGLRIPFVAYWPGKIAPGQVSDHLCYFPDILPTIAEVTGATPPADIDGISILPTLIGEEAAGHPQQQHEYLYWEIGGWTAIRQGELACRPAQRQRRLGTVRPEHGSQRIERPGRPASRRAGQAEGAGRRRARTRGRRHLLDHRTPRAGPPRQVRQAGRHQPGGHARRSAERR